MNNENATETGASRTLTRCWARRSSIWMSVEVLPLMPELIIKQDGTAKNGPGVHLDELESRFAYSENNLP